jgi:hypothetical protein
MLDSLKQNILVLVDLDANMQLAAMTEWFVELRQFISFFWHPNLLPYIFAKKLPI